MNHKLTHNSADPLLASLARHETLNFWLTNRIPRRLLTRLMGRVSRIDSPLLARLLIAVWRLFAEDLRLDEAKHARFRSLHACFIRELKPGARPVDPDPQTIVSPCDAIVGASGKLAGTTLLQAKGSPYRLEELLGDPEQVERYRDGGYITLRLTSSMYHRFHAPCDCSVGEVRYIAGDVWNVNPPTLKRIERLFCKNERAVIPLHAPAFGGQCITLVPVAAVLVASIRLHFIDPLLHLDYRGPTTISCSASLRKGDEMGYFQHGSTIIVFMRRGLRLRREIRPGVRIKVGQALIEPENN